MSDDTSVAARARRAVEFAVYVPVGIACYLRDVAPTLITVLKARGQGEVSRRGEHIGDAVRHVRTRGEALIAFGLPHRGAPHERVPAEPAESDAAPAPVDDLAAARTDRAAAAQLAIPGYDSLSASQVVDHLQGLEPDELEAVRRYEAAHRNRRTILGKIEQLTA
jgi:hypothetical protein